MPYGQLELWGGLECTVARIGDSFRNQIKETGHFDRESDLDLIHELGIRTIRYPVVWETIAPADPDTCDWTWTDRRLKRMRELGIEVIAGLVHHGSGPAYTNLLDPQFPEKLARFAEQVARRYPWIAKYTPVNEPLTTARFSGLYGHWYPHRRSESAFLHALVNECRGTALAMAAIRRVNPRAELVQTEDLGKVFSTGSLSYQADYENERRWLSFDLLTGAVGRDHAFYGALLAHKVREGDLDVLMSGEGAPDVIGINHYATSDRFLDPEHKNYPACFLGGNLRERYADVEAVRIDLPPHELGIGARLTEVWERYGIPLAVTEAHHGSTRDEQLRWLVETWREAERLRASGADVRAVTTWSMFGAVDWNSLLVRKSGFYEPGAFDVRSGEPRKTAIGRAVETLAKTSAFEHPVLDQPGWWKRGIRFYHKPERGPAMGRPIVVVGATGTLGRAFERICAVRGLPCVLLGRNELDITDDGSVEKAICERKPWAVVNAAGYVRVADAERERDLCFSGNVHGAVNIAHACYRAGLPFVTFSSDLVFDGALGRAYVENDEPRPLCVYGMSKAEAERQVAAIHSDALVVRTSAFFGPWDQANFVWQSLRQLSEGGDLQPDNSIVSPTYVPDLVNAVLDLLIDEESGVWHLANDGMASWQELAEQAAHRAGIDWRCSWRPEGAAKRSTALSSTRGLLLPKLEDALGRFFSECEVDWASARRA